MSMAWTTTENTQTIITAMRVAAEHGATLCEFPELAITGFHRRIREEAKPEIVEPALMRVRASCAENAIAAVIGVPLFRSDGGIVNAVEFIDRHGASIGHVEKVGITPAEATFLQAGSSRPVLAFEGFRSTAIICREASDHKEICESLAPDEAEIIFWPGIMRPDPERPERAEHHIEDACAIAAHTRAYVIQSNWPNSLNYPNENPTLGHSIVISPSGEVLFRLPKAVAGIGLFNLGESAFQWIEI
jgi:omega-amidase